MRLLVINSNTSQYVTDVVAAGAKQFASPDTELVFATGQFGARVVASRTENVIAAHSTIDLIARHASKCDGVLIAVSYDSGLRAAREFLGLPVVSLTEASLLTALTLGTRVGLISFGGGATSLYLETVDSYGLGSRICGTRRLQTDAPYRGGDQKEVNEMIVEAAGQLIDQHDAEVIVLLGAVMAGRSVQLQDRVPVPLLDGIRCAVPMLEMMVKVGARAPTRGSYALPSERESVGLSADIGQKLRSVRG